MPDEKKELQARYAHYQTILSEMTLMSDAFMRNVLKVAECAEYVLQVILEKPDLGSWMWLCRRITRICRGGQRCWTAWHRMRTETVST